MNWDACGSTSGVRGTFPSQWSATRSQVNPRLSGEYFTTNVTADFGAGSPPRVRGKPPRHPHQTDHPRFTPAFAGNTTSWHIQIQVTLGPPPRARNTPGVSLPQPNGPVHPACAGNTSASQTAMWAPVGSSPRVRGIRHLGRAAQWPHRFTPACAGNTRWVWRNFTPEQGSPPRVRGILD